MHNKAITSTIATVVLLGIHGCQYPLAKSCCLLFTCRNTKVPNEDNERETGENHHSRTNPKTPNVIKVPENVHANQEYWNAKVHVVVVKEKLKRVAKRQSSSSHGDRQKWSRKRGGKKEKLVCPLQNPNSNSAPVLPEIFVALLNTFRLDEIVDKDCFSVTYEILDDVDLQIAEIRAKTRKNSLRQAKVTCFISAPIDLVQV